MLAILLQRALASIAELKIRNISHRTIDSDLMPAPMREILAIDRSTGAFYDDFTFRFNDPFIMT